MKIMQTLFPYKQCCYFFVKDLSHWNFILIYFSHKTRNSCVLKKNKIKKNKNQIVTLFEIVMNKTVTKIKMVSKSFHNAKLRCISGDLGILKPFIQSMAKQSSSHQAVFQNKD